MTWKSERGSQKLEFEKPAQNHKKRTSFVKTLKTLKLGTSKTYKKKPTRTTTLLSLMMSRDGGTQTPPELSLLLWQKLKNKKSLGKKTNTL